MQVREVLAELRQADVLEHADGADRVEATVDVAVVLDAELDTVDSGRRSPRHSRTSAWFFDNVTPTASTP